MKIRFSFLMLFTFLSIQLFAQPFGSEYDNADGTSMVPIKMDAEAYMEVFESEGYEIVRMELDILLTNKETFRTLQDGWSYGIFAFGDYRFEKIDLRVYKMVEGEWIELYEGDDQMGYEAIEGTNSVLIKLIPEVSAEYKFRVEALEYSEGYSGGHYGLFVFHE
ncbi:MAG: hypothetical protein JXA68_09365 [Ignavibacteriales bacterium]|nr:hypothetical protein [Ignavibacteriales bacterium]